MFSIRFNSVDGSKAEPFCLFADCEVEYDGRAYGILERGNYIILYKEDLSLSIHNCNHITPRNYLGAGARLVINDNIITGILKKEKVTIKLHNIIHQTNLINWSSNLVKICKTERELVMKLFNNWYDYIDAELEMIILESGSDVGSIDMLGIEGDGSLHVVEAKRKTASLADCSQLDRYVNHFKEINNNVTGYIASPTISKNPLKYLDKKGYKWIKINFD